MTAEYKRVAKKQMRVVEKNISFVVDASIKARGLRSRVIKWYRKNARTFPWRSTSDPYLILLAEVLLQQTFARKVVPVYERLIEEYPTPIALAKAEEGTLRSILYPLGFLYRSRTLIECAKLIRDRFNGRIPNRFEELLELPGVGPYTASALCVFALGERRTVMDTNTIRIFARVFKLPIKLPSSAPSAVIRSIGDLLVPKARSKEFNYALLDLAAVHCTHYSPNCPTCPLRDICCYYEARKKDEANAYAARVDG